MSGVFSRGGVYSPELTNVLERLDALVDWERRGRVRGAARLMRVSADPARSVLRRLGFTSPTFRAVHVTGSKGKGTVSALVAAGLGLSQTGVFSSPHVERVNERIAVRGKPISDSALAGALTRALDARAEQPVINSATWFDIVTAAALSEFQKQRLHHAVIEVGMGGRRDATAVLRAPVSVITNVMDEHADIIGPTRKHIAVEKAGVIAPGATVVLGLRKDDPLASVFAAEAEMQNTRAQIVHVPPQDDAPLFEHNLAMARAALGPLGGTLSEYDARAALRRLPARQEHFAVGEGVRRVDVVLDGAHVPFSVGAVLAEAKAEGAIAVVGVGAEKNAHDICEHLRDAGVAHVVVTATGKQDVYMQPEPLALVLRRTGVDHRRISVVNCPGKALREAINRAAAQGSGERRVVVVGSLHLAGRVRGILREMAADSAHLDAAGGHEAGLAGR